MPINEIENKQINSRNNNFPVFFEQNISPISKKGLLLRDFLTKKKI
jgi:hypothetical protein